VGEEQVSPLGGDGARGGHHAERIEPRSPKSRLLREFSACGVGGFLAFVDGAAGQIGDLCVVEVVVLGDHGHLSAVDGQDADGVLLAELALTSSHGAWALYVSLHSLAASRVLGPVPTVMEGDGATLGDLDDVLHHLNQHEAVLRRIDPELVQRTRDAVVGWVGHRETRLVGLIPVLDGLEGITGASLPHLLPPAM
jgi:hypothetical protein